MDLEERRHHERCGLQTSAMRQLALTQANDSKRGSDSVQGSSSLAAIGKDEQLQLLWNLLRPNAAYPGDLNNSWKEIGFQNANPLGDCAASGYLPIECLIYLAQTYPEKTQDLMKNQPVQPFPLCSTAVNVVELVCELLALPQYLESEQKDQKTVDSDYNHSQLFDVFCRAPNQEAPMFRELVVRILLLLREATLGL